MNFVFSSRLSFLSLVLSVPSTNQPNNKPTNQPIKQPMKRLLLFFGRKTPPDYCLPWSVPGTYIRYTYLPLKVIQDVCGGREGEEEGQNQTPITHINPYITRISYFSIHHPYPAQVTNDANVPLC